MTITKQLIESMITGYLEESYEDDNIVESIFEEVSEETWEAIEEAILNELSPELMARYADAASDDYMRKSKYDSRKKGIDTALKKIGAGSGTRKQVQKRLERGRKSYDSEMQRSGVRNPKYVRSEKGNRAQQSVSSSVELEAGRRDMKDLSPEEFKKKYRTTKTKWLKDARADAARKGRASDRDS